MNVAEVPDDDLPDDRPLLEYVDVDEPDDRAASPVLLFAGGSTVSTCVCASGFDATINGESSMNASVFRSSSNVNEQFGSFGVCGRPALLNSPEGCCCCKLKLA
jgi:hypothetical protein